MVCGVLPLIEWLESYGTMVRADKVQGSSEVGSPRECLTYCYIRIDFACSLLAELGSGLGIVSLRSSPIGSGGAEMSSHIREGQEQLVVIACVVFYLYCEIILV